MADCNSITNPPPNQLVRVEPALNRTTSTQTEAGHNALLENNTPVAQEEESVVQFIKVVETSLSSSTLSWLPYSLQEYHIPYFFSNYVDGKPWSLREVVKEPDFKKELLNLCDNHSPALSKAVENLKSSIGKGEQLDQKLKTVFDALKSYFKLQENRTVPSIISLLKAFQKVNVLDDLLVEYLETHFDDQFPEESAALWEWLDKCISPARFFTPETLAAESGAMTLKDEFIVADMLCKKHPNWLATSLANESIYEDWLNAFDLHAKKINEEIFTRANKELFTPKGAVFKAFEIFYRQCNNVSAEDLLIIAVCIREAKSVREFFVSLLNQVVLNQHKQLRGVLREVKAVFQDSGGLKKQAFWSQYHRLNSYAEELIEVKSGEDLSLESLGIEIKTFVDALDLAGNTDVSLL